MYHEINLLDGRIFTTADVYQKPYAIDATNDQWQHLVWAFKDSGTKVGLYGLTRVPQNFIGDTSLVVVWNTTATTGVAAFEFRYRVVSGDDSASLDQAGQTQLQTGTDSASATANNQMQVSLSLTGSNFSVGATVEWFFARDGTSIGDTLAADVLLHGLFFKYSDNTV